MCDDGLVIDLSTMNAVHVDPVTRIARVQAGARWADLTALPTGSDSPPPAARSRSPVAGLTLGGGLGRTHRAFGLACDNLRSIEIVTADGVVRTASADENADLFWASRGGGRGLGVVTSFEFYLHPLGPEVAVAQVAYPADDAEACLRAWRDLAAVAPETFSPQALLWTLPADPALPQHLQRSRTLLVAAMYAGDPAESDDVLAPYRQITDPLVDLSVTRPYGTSRAPLIPSSPKETATTSSRT